MIITIDGPAAAGKSTVAKELAKRLCFDYLDTGAMYRAVTLAGLRAGCDFDDPAQVESLLEAIKIEMPPGKVFLNGNDVTDEIRTPEVTNASGKVASNIAIRQHLVRLQQQFAAGRNIICEGRDQGTIVFPNAECKYFLVASPEQRARRRYEELIARGQNVSYEDVLADQFARDERDAARDIAPMRPAPDAHVIDTTTLTLDEVVARLEEEVRRCGIKSRTSGTNPPTS